MLYGQVIMLRAEADATVVIFLYGVFFSFFFLFLFQIGSLCIVLAVLVLVHEMYKPSLNSKKSSCLCLPSAILHRFLFCFPLRPKTCIVFFVAYSCF